MKNKRKCLIMLTAFIAATTMIFSVMPYESIEVQAAEKLSNSKTKALADTIKKNQSDQKILESKILQTKTEAGAAAETKKNLDKKISLKEEEIETTNKLIVALNEDVKLKEADILLKEADISLRFEQFKERICVSYEEGNSTYLEMVFGAESFSDFLSRTEILKNLFDYDKRTMEILESDKEILIAEQEELNAQKDDLVKTKNALLLVEKSLKQAKEEAQSYLNQLAKDEIELKKMLEEKQEEEEKYNKVLEDYLKELQKQEKNTTYVGGEFIWPVSRSYMGISSGFANRVSPITGKREYHNGIDIPAPYNSPVYASNGGKVIKAEFHYSYGNYVMIDHGGGKSTLYGHNTILRVSVGDIVSQGQQIADIGSTGFSTGSHCHFSVYINGSVVDPRNYVG